MVLVDTSVWIDFFAAKTAAHVVVLESLLAQTVDVCLCGIVLSEVLQGIADEKEFKETKRLFDALIFLPMERKTFLLSANIYRTLRKKGITIRKPVDCMIAAVAIEHNARLLHNDRDFSAIARGYGLRCVEHA